MSLVSLKSAFRAAVESTGIALLPPADALAGEFEGVVSDVSVGDFKVVDQVRNLPHGTKLSECSVTCSIRAADDNLDAADTLLRLELDKLFVGFQTLRTTLCDQLGQSVDLGIVGSDSEILTPEGSPSTYLAASILFTVKHRF